MGGGGGLARSQAQDGGGGGLGYSQVQHGGGGGEGPSLLLGLRGVAGF